MRIIRHMYENGKYFWGGDENATGLVREGYQHAAEHLGYSKSHGNIAYYGADLVLSAYGAIAKTTTAKNAAEAYQIAAKPNLKPMPWTRTPKAKQFKLFRYSSEDYLRGYQAMSKGALAFEVWADGITIKTLNNEFKND